MSEHAVDWGPPGDDDWGTVTWVSLWDSAAPRRPESRWERFLRFLLGWDPLVPPELLWAGPLGDGEATPLMKDGDTLTFEFGGVIQ